MKSGQKVGKYILGDRIARGGMAEVWAARVEGPEGFVKPVALKFVVDSGDPDLDRLFATEARVAAQLQHPNLVTVFDFDRIVDATDFGSPGRYYIAMERVEGHDLRRVLETARDCGSRLPAALALYVAAEVLQGLRYVHERATPGERLGSSLIHRDVSPHNVLVAFTGDVKLSDFGIAKSVVPRALTAATRPGLVRGKLSYAAPEQVRGGAVDHRSDQFSLGVTLWEMLAGRRLFAGTSDVEILGRVLGGQIPALPRERGIDPSIEGLVRRMLEVLPERRFPTTAAALSAVVGLPGYSGDGAVLGAWMAALFSLRDPALPPTQELPAPGGGARRVARSLPLSGLGATLMLAEPPVAVAPPIFPASAGTQARTPKPSIGRASSGGTHRIDLVRSRVPTTPRSIAVKRQTAGHARARRPAHGRHRGPGGVPTPWLRWGLVAMGVAALAWGAALGVRRQPRQEVGGGPGAKAMFMRRPARSSIENATISERMPIVAEPVRSGDQQVIDRAEDPSPGAASGGWSPTGQSTAAAATVPGAFGGPEPVAADDRPDSPSALPGPPEGPVISAAGAVLPGARESAAAPLPTPTPTPAAPALGPPIRYNPNGAPIIE